jgi:hypothetical protein
MSLVSLLLPPFCHCYPPANVEGLERIAEGHWLSKMEHQEAGNNADDDNPALLLMFPLPSLAHLDIVVLLVRTLFDSSLPNPPLSLWHCLPPAFLIVECPHYQSITSSIV